MIVGKNHPDIFTAIKEFRKEQGDTEVQILELSLGRGEKMLQKKKMVGNSKKTEENCRFI